MDMPSISELPEAETRHSSATWNSPVQFVLWSALLSAIKYYSDEQHRTFFFTPSKKWRILFHGWRPVDFSAIGTIFSSFTPLAP